MSIARIMMIGVTELIDCRAVDPAGEDLEDEEDIIGDLLDA